jgi:hypothetical protein
MQARGLPVSALGVAEAYTPWLKALVIDARDTHCTTALRARGVEAIEADIVMSDRAREVALARHLLAHA